MKRKISITLAALSALAAKATTLVLFIVVAAVGAVVVWKLVAVIHKIWPECHNPDTGAVITNVVQVTHFENMVFQSIDGRVVDGSTFPTTNSASIATPASVVLPTGFAISYGIEDVPWIDVGSSDQSPHIQTPYVKDGDSVTYTMFGSGVKLGVVSHPSGGYANASFAVLEQDTESYQVVIERSPDLLNWSPVFTNNNCMKFDAKTWTDTAPLPDRGFYRIKVQ